MPFHGDGIISQFEGYEQLAELDWEDYRTRYGNIQRLDLILEAEHDSANRYKLSKQADVLMLFYLFSAEELGALFTRLGYPFDPETMPRNVAYYDSRSSHGSTLSRVVHAWVLARSDRPRAMTLLRGGAAERCERYPAGHHRGGRASRRHGGNGRSGAARLDGDRSHGGCAAAQSAIAAGAGAPRHAHPLSRAFARSAADARPRSPCAAASAARRRSSWESRTKCTSSLAAARVFSSSTEQRRTSKGFLQLSLPALAMVSGMPSADRSDTSGLQSG